MNLTKPERRPRKIRGRAGERWFYVDRKWCAFYRADDGGVSVRGVTLPTSQLRRALAAVDKAVAAQSTGRKR